MKQVKGLSSGFGSASIIHRSPDIVSKKRASLGIFMRKGDDSSDDEQPNKWGSNFSYQNVAAAPFKSLYKSSPIV